jgi:hypothetical protein
MGRSAGKLDVVEFGRQTIQSGDLDPLYIALNRVEMPRAQQARWLLAYWCCYHAGAASFLSDQTDDQFWTTLKAAARNDDGDINYPSPVSHQRWPRGKERRHWRGEAAVASAQHLFGRFKTANDCLNFLVTATDPMEAMSTPAFIMKRAQSLNGFGPWISFKVADMIDALGIRDLDFGSSAVFMFDQPQEAALEVWRHQMKVAPNVKPRNPVETRDRVVAWLLDQFEGLPCPHRPERGIRLQEVETVLCKWKSHLSGHYPLGNDIQEIGEGLEPWTGVSETAAKLSSVLGDLA